MNKLHFADEEYYLTSGCLLKLASKASELFESSEAKERQALARLFIKEVKILNDKVDVEFLEFPELAHQEPVQILKQPSKWLLLKDLFCNQRLQFDCTIDDLKIFYSSLGFNDQSGSNFVQLTA